MKTFFTCLILFLAVGCFAQPQLDSNAFKWDKTKLLPTTVFTIAYGMPNEQAKFIHNNIILTNYKFQNIGPVLMRIDMRISERTTIGLCYGYSSYYITDYNNITSNNINKTYVNSIGARFNGYFIVRKHVAFYIGIGGGFCINQYQDSDHGIAVTYKKITLTHLYGDIVAGFKYKPIRFFNIFVEAGYNRFSIFNVGASFVIKK